MNCREFARELATPTDGIDPAELQRHLGDCPRCAAESDAARQLDRLWAATRPAEPSPAAWGRLWDSVTTALDAPATIPLAGERPRRRWLGPVIATALIAQAAAVILAVGLLVSGQASTKSGPGPIARVEGSGQIVVFNVEPGDTLFLELEESGDGDTVVCTPSRISTEDLVTFDSEGVSEPTEMAGLAGVDILNAMESM
jgi:hypothetical protein